MKRILFILFLFASKVAYPQGCIDSVPGDTCTNNNVTLITYNSARVNATVPSQGVTTLTLVYVRSGFTDTVYASGVGSSALRNITGLQSGTLYKYYYYSGCPPYTWYQHHYYTFTTANSNVTYAPERATRFPYVIGDTGWKAPRVDTSLFRAPNTAGGDIVFKPSDKKFYGYNGDYWVWLGVDSAGILPILNRKVDSVTVYGDSLFYWIQGVSYGYIMPAAVTELKSAGSGYNIAIDGTDSVKRIQVGAGLTVDTTTNGIIKITNNGEIAKDSIYGDFINVSSWASLPSTLTSTGGTFSYNGVSGLTMSAGNNTYFDNRIETANYTTSQNLSSTLVFTVTSKDSGVFVGRYSHSSAGKLGYVFVVKRTGTSTARLEYHGNAAYVDKGVLAYSADFTWTNGSTYRVYTTANSAVMSARVDRIDTLAAANADVLETAALQYKIKWNGNSSLGEAYPNIGSPYFGSLSGTYRVRSFSETHYDSKYADVVFMGTSIETRYNESSLQNDFINKAFQETNLKVSVFAGPGDQLIDMRSNFVNTRLSHPGYVIVEFINDGAAAIRAQLPSLIDSITSIGAVPVVLQIFKDVDRDTTTMRICNQYNVQRINFGAISTTDDFIDATTHPNDAGGYRIAMLIKSELPTLIKTKGVERESFMGLQDVKITYPPTDGDLIQWSNSSNAYINTPVATFGNSFIKNQYSANQTADFRITGTASVIGTLRLGTTGTFGSEKIINYENTVDGDGMVFQNDGATSPIVGKIAKLALYGTNGGGAAAFQNRFVTEDFLTGGQALSSYAGSLDFLTGARSLRMRITAAGFVGINTTTPDSTGTINGSLHVTGNSLFDGNVGIGVSAPTGKLHVMANAIDALFVDNATGYVGIGTVTPSATLYVEGGIGSNGVADIGGGSTYMYINGTQSAFGDAHGNDDGSIISVEPGYNWAYYDNSGHTGKFGINTNSPTEALDVNGNIIASGTITPSDRRYKTNIKSFDNGLSLINKLNPTTYEYKQGLQRKFNKGKQFGLIAQEVEKIIPEVVTTGKDGYKAINYTELIPILISAIQEQQKQIDDLKLQLKDKK